MSAQNVLPSKIPLKDWVKHPTTVMLIFAVSAAWALLFVYTKTLSQRSSECLEQVQYLRDRVSKLEMQQDEYVRTIMQKEMLIENLKEKSK